MTTPPGWRNLGEQPVYETPWFRLRQARVELPGGRQEDARRRIARRTGRGRSVFHRLWIPGRNHCGQLRHYD